MGLGKFCICDCMFCVNCGGILPVDPYLKGIHNGSMCLLACGLWKLCVRVSIMVCQNML